jgi:cell division protein FtsW
MKLLKDLTDKKEPDYILFFISSILIIIGIVFSYSLSIYTVVHLGYDQFHFLIRQLFVGVVSILVMWSFAQLKPEKLITIISWGLFTIFGLLILFMQIIPSSYIVESGGASRWIRLPGLSISPVEFFKIGFIYYLAHSFHRRIYFTRNQSFLDEVKLIIPYGVIF